MSLLITVYLKITKRTDDGHCQMEAETYLHLIEHTARLFPLEVNEETTWTQDHMESYLLLRAESIDFVEMKCFVVDALNRRGFDIACVKMYADADQLDDAVMMDIMNKQPPQKTKKKKSLLGVVKHYMFTKMGIGDMISDEYDEELWEEEEE